MTERNEDAAPSLREAQDNLVQAREDFFRKRDALRARLMAPVQGVVDSARGIFFRRQWMNNVIQRHPAVALGAVLFIGYGLTRLFTRRRSQKKWYKKGRKMHGRHCK